MTLLTDKWRIDANRRQGIERRAEMILYYINEIDQAVDALSSMPTFETRAEAVLNEAQAQLFALRVKLAEKERKE